MVPNVRASTGIEGCTIATRLIMPRASHDWRPAGGGPRVERHGTDRTGAWPHRVVRAAVGRDPRTARGVGQDRILDCQRRHRRGGLYGPREADALPRTQAVSAQHRVRQRGGGPGRGRGCDNVQAGGPGTELLPPRRLREGRRGADGPADTSGPRRPRGGVRTAWPA